MEILKIYINIIETNEVVSENMTVRMLLFDGHCTGEFFNGTILHGGVDTQMIHKDQSVTLSARYMLKGYDSEDNPCSMYIENNAKGDMDYTQPKIYTDSKCLKWLEQKKLTGRIENDKGNLVIIIETNIKN